MTRIVVDPGRQLELVLRFEVFVLARVAEDQEEGDRDRQVDAQAEQHFGFRLHLTQRLTHRG